jgi:serine/threonine protein kinase
MLLAKILLLTRLTHFRSYQCTQTVLYCTDAGEKSEVKSEGQDAGPPLPGDVLLGREGKQYRILSSIGQGSSGFLYLALEAQTKREFAVKVRCPSQRGCFS